MPTAPLYAYSFVAALVILAALSLRLARRSPAWRPVAASLAALACIDIARLWTAPLGATRAQPWWGLDVALVALWPVAVGVGLLQGQRPALVARVRASESITEHGNVSVRVAEKSGDLPHGSDHHTHLAEHIHPPILPRLALLAALAIALGACRPALPALAYLGALRALRWGLAGLWVERIATEVTRYRVVDHSLQDLRRRRGPQHVGEMHAHAPTVARAPLACALVLAGCNVAGLLAGAWLVPPWEPPAWALAGPVTWAAYVVCGVVMAREVWRGRRA